MSKPTLTMAVLNWNRPKQIDFVLSTLEQQTLKPVIFVWNNGQPRLFPTADWVVQSNQNIACVASWMMLTRAETDYIGTIGDDVLVCDTQVLEHAVDFLSRQDDPDMIVGAAGVRLKAGKTYGDSDHIHCCSNFGFVKGEMAAPVDVVKGWFSIMRRDVLAKVPRMIDRGFIEDDIFVSGHAARGEKGKHRVLGMLRGRCKDLFDTSDVALCSRKDHLLRRELARRKYCFGL